MTHAALTAEAHRELRVRPERGPDYGDAIQAALTGHLVLSTLHTNDAPEAVTRLMDIGVEPYLISSSLLGVLAQRDSKARNTRRWWIFQRRPIRPVRSHRALSRPRPSENVGWL